MYMYLYQLDNVTTAKNPVMQIWIEPYNFTYQTKLFEKMPDYDGDGGDRQKSTTNDDK